MFSANCCQTCSLLKSVDDDGQHSGDDSALYQDESGVVVNNFGYDYDGGDYADSENHAYSTASTDLATSTNATEASPTTSD